jgi:predicted PurR-regulated permease PerM
LIIAFLALALVFEIITWVHLADEWSVIPVFACAIYYALGNLLPRVRNIGWNPLVLLIVVIPIVGLLFWLSLFFIPPNKEQLVNLESTSKPV